MSDRNFRSLQRLEGNASTSRTLNLHAVWKHSRGEEDYARHPFFTSPVLNRAIILKHRMRRDEADVFWTPRTNGTKVIIPIDPTNLKLGGQYFFVGQKDVDRMLTALGIANEANGQDLHILNIIDEIPSLDPFLLREKLKRCGHEPSRFYFELSEADLRKMFSFVQSELEPLVRLTFSGAGGALRTAALVNKILANSVDSDLDPLRQVLKLTPTDFEEGVFSWKGFLYYKWSLVALLPEIQQVTYEIDRVVPRGFMDADMRIYLSKTRGLIRSCMTLALETVGATLAIYDKAFKALVAENDPAQFRTFLLDAPNLFADLGERLGSLQHITSFWRFRYPQGSRAMILAEDLVECFQDFESSLNFPETAELFRAA